MDLNFPAPLTNLILRSSYAIHSAKNLGKYILLAPLNLSKKIAKVAAEGIQKIARVAIERILRAARSGMDFLRALKTRIEIYCHPDGDQARLYRIALYNESHAVFQSDIRFPINQPLNPTFNVFGNRSIEKSAELKPIVYGILTRNSAFNQVGETHGLNPQNFIFVLHLSLNPTNPAHRTGEVTLRVPILFNDTRTAIRDSGFQVPLTTIAEIENSPEAQLICSGRGKCHSVTLRAHNVFNFTVNGTRPIFVADASPLRVEWIRTVVRGGFRPPL